MSTKEKTTNLWEVNNEFEELQYKLCTLEETINAVTTVVNEGLITPADMGWAFSGLYNNCKEIREKLENLTAIQFEIFKNIHNSTIGEYCL